MSLNDYAMGQPAARITSKPHYSLVYLPSTVAKYRSQAHLNESGAGQQFGKPQWDNILVRDVFGFRAHESLRKIPGVDFDIVLYMLYMSSK